MRQKESNTKAISLAQSFRSVQMVEEQEQVVAALKMGVESPYIFAETCWQKPSNTPGVLNCCGCCSYLATDAHWRVCRECISPVFAGSKPRCPIYPLLARYQWLLAPIAIKITTKMITIKITNPMLVSVRLV